MWVKAVGSFSSPLLIEEVGRGEECILNNAQERRKVQIVANKTATVQDLVSVIQNWDDVDHLEKLAMYWGEYKRIHCQDCNSRFASEFGDEQLALAEKVLQDYSSKNYKNWTTAILRNDLAASKKSLQRNLERFEEDQADGERLNKLSFGSKWEEKGAQYSAIVNEKIKRHKATISAISIVLEKRGVSTK